MELPIFKIRASAASEILGGTIGLSDAQQFTLSGYRDRIKEFEAGDKKKALTPKMQMEFDKLIYKEANPDLPAGAKTYCEKWLKEKLYDRRKNFTGKYLDKGIQCEEGSIVYGAEHLNWGPVQKNEEWFSDDWMEGTPDIIAQLPIPGSSVDDDTIQNTVIDMKNVWDCFTLPLFETEIPTAGYYDQLQVYMHLVSLEYKIDFHNAILCYSLMDAPLDVMKKEMRRVSWEEGQMGLITDEIYQRVQREMTYSNLGPELRLKTFAVKFDPAVIEELKLRVEMCRVYIAQLIENKQHLLQAA